MTQGPKLELPMTNGGRLIITRSCMTKDALFVEHWNADGVLEDTWTRSIDELENLFRLASKLEA